MYNPDLVEVCLPLPRVNNTTYSNEELEEQIYGGTPYEVLKRVEKENSIKFFLTTDEEIKLKNGEYLFPLPVVTVDEVKKYLTPKTLKLVTDKHIQIEIEEQIALRTSYNQFLSEFLFKYNSRLELDFSKEQILFIYEVLLLQFLGAQYFEYLNEVEEYGKEILKKESLYNQMFQTLKLK